MSCITWAETETALLQENQNCRLYYESVILNESRAISVYLTGYKPAIVKHINSTYNTDNRRNSVA